MMTCNSTFSKFTLLSLIWIFTQMAFGLPQSSAQGLRNRLRSELTFPDPISQGDALRPIVGVLDSGNEPITIAEQDEVWMIDGRECHCNPDDLSLLEAAQFVESQWEPRCLQSLVDAHAADPSKATLIYVHGDRTDDYWAARRGLQFYQNVFGNAPEPRAGVRFVIWAWRSEKIQNRPLRDYPIKSTRARLVGRTLATYLGQFPDQRLVLAGYSLGCQAWLEALEQFSMTNPQQIHRCGSGYQVCLLAPALDGNYVAAHRRCVAGSELVARADIFDNSADRALLCSRVLGSRSAPGGGASIQSLAMQGGLPLSQITLIDLRDEVGKKHAVVNYSAVPIFGCRLRGMVEAANVLPAIELPPAMESPPAIETAAACSAIMIEPAPFVESASAAEIVDSSSGR